ncbi:MAG: hypothetical protein PHT54_03685 [Candidatus Nanoarchaeia archaeon]|nr:hypothetical protein [Candidatus Nanoarchaeia archaeon]
MKKIFGLGLVLILCCGFVSADMFKAALMVSDAGIVSGDFKNIFGGIGLIYSISNIDTVSSAMMIAGKLAQMGKYEDASKNINQIGSYVGTAEGILNSDVEGAAKSILGLLSPEIAGQLGTAQNIVDELFEKSEAKPKEKPEATTTAIVDLSGAATKTNQKYDITIDEDQCNFIFWIDTKEGFSGDTIKGCKFKGDSAETASKEQALTQLNKALGFDEKNGITRVVDMDIYFNDEEKILELESNKEGGKVYFKINNEEYKYEQFSKTSLFSFKINEKKLEIDHINLINVKNKKYIFPKYEVEPKGEECSIFYYGYFNRFSCKQGSMTLTNLKSGETRQITSESGLVIVELPGAGNPRLRIPAGEEICLNDNSCQNYFLEDENGYTVRGNFENKLGIERICAGKSRGISLLKGNLFVQKGQVGEQSCFELDYLENENEFGEYSLTMDSEGYQLCLKDGNKITGGATISEEAQKITEECGKVVVSNNVKITKSGIPKSKEEFKKNCNDIYAKVMGWGKEDLGKETMTSGELEILKENLYRREGHIYGGCTFSTVVWEGRCGEQGIKKNYRPEVDILLNFCGSSGETDIIENENYFKGEKDNAFCTCRYGAGFLCDDAGLVDSAKEDGCYLAKTTTKKQTTTKKTSQPKQEILDQNEIVCCKMDADPKREIKEEDIGNYADWSNMVNNCKSGDFIIGGSCRVVATTYFKRNYLCQYRKDCK